MLNYKLRFLIVILILFILLLAGCSVSRQQGASEDSAPAGSTAAGESSSVTDSAEASSEGESATVADSVGEGSVNESPASASDNVSPPATPAPTSEQQNTLPPSEQPKDATWVIDVNDTQQITDEMGIIWNYTLTFHASKPGGTDATGDYAGEALLKIEPDFASAQAAAESEGTELLSMIFNYRAECESLTFEVMEFSQDKYDQLMRQYNKDNSLQPADPGVSNDFFAVTGATFNSTQEPVTMTIQTDEGPKTGSGGGGGVTVTVPTEISVDGATAYVFFYNTPHPLERAFKGTITGDMLN